MAEEWGCKLRDEGQRGWRRACRWSPWPLRKSSSRGHSVIFRGGLLLPSSWFPPELSPCLRTRGYRLFSGFEKWVSGLALFFQTLRSEPGRDDLDLDIKSSMVGWGESPRGLCNRGDKKRPVPRSRFPLDMSARQAVSVGDKGLTLEANWWLWVPTAWGLVLS